MLPLHQRDIIQQASLFAVGFEPTNDCLEGNLSTIDSALIFAVTNLKLGPLDRERSCVYRLSADCSTFELQEEIWYRRLDSNQPHTDFQSAALPDELLRHNNFLWGVIPESNW